jgi:hypothetical protein
VNPSATWVGLKSLKSFLRKETGVRIQKTSKNQNLGATDDGTSELRRPEINVKSIEQGAKDRASEIRGQRSEISQEPEIGAEEIRSSASKHRAAGFVKTTRGQG